jgi:hypothetical protein
MQLGVLDQLHQLAVALHQLAVVVLQLRPVFKMGLGLQEGSVVRYVALPKVNIKIYNISSHPVEPRIARRLCHKAVAEVVLMFLVSNNYNVI